jgi:polyisoprenoid-binding protein YceI
MSQTDRTDAAVRLAAGSWSIATGSHASFVVRNLGFKKVTGTIPIQRAEVVVDDAGVIISVHAELDLAAIDTANRRRDIDLARPKLLDTKQFPLMTFDGALGSGGSSGLVVQGTLAAHGRTVPLDLSVIVERTGAGQLSVRVKAEFDREDLGVKARGFMIGRRIEVQINATFHLAS